jgi:hypothetical protein
MKTKLDTKIKWNKILRNEIEKKNQEKNLKKIAIKRMMTKLNIKTKRNKMMKCEIKKQVKKKY